MERCPRNGLEAEFSPEDDSMLGFRRIAFPALGLKTHACRISNVKAASKPVMAPSAASNPRTALTVMLVRNPRVGCRGFLSAAGRHPESHSVFRFQGCHWQSRASLRAPISTLGTSIIALPNPNDREPSSPVRVDSTSPPPDGAL